jgi:REP element-mobilizing transposase RayT
MKDRKLSRLKDYDYSENGYYFITICTQNRMEWFGKIEDEEMHLNMVGEIAKNFWKEIPIHFRNAKIDEFAVMPNHIHGILIIEETSVGNAYMRSLQSRTKMLLSKAIQQYKSSVTRKINTLEKGSCFKWQKSFYDHIIRSERSLENLWQYIMNNPLKWELDIENRENAKISHVESCKHYYGEIIKGGG